MYRAGRTAWELVAVGAATAVGITTRDPGFIVITFLGALVLPRVLGLTPPGAATGVDSVQDPSGRVARAGADGACTGRKASEPETSAATPQSV